MTAQRPTKGKRVIHAMKLWARPEHYEVRCCCGVTSPECASVTEALAWKKWHRAAAVSDRQEKAK